jgi:hypothetical protein
MSSETTSPANHRRPAGYNHYNPVNVHLRNSLGTLILGILSVMMLAALLRAQARNRELLTRLLKEQGNGEAG